MLNAHSRISILNEFWKLYPALADPQTNLEQLRALVVSRLGLPDEAIPPVSPGADAGWRFVESALATKATSEGKVRWGIKDPRLTYFLEMFRDRWPDARNVLIIRDPRATVLSAIQRQWNVANVYAGARLWREEVETQLAFSDRRPEDWCVVKYEDLVSRPADELTRLCAFLGESFEPTMLTYHKQPEVVLYANVVDPERREQYLKAKPNWAKPVDGGRAEKWRSALSVRQLAVIEQVCGLLMQRLGYEHAAPVRAISALRRAGYTIHQEVMTRWWWKRRSWGLR
jgi:hypothetical protein